jgi:acyl transferase domain-containing protein/thioesterase domain-containing protein/aryl carrier-like protein
MKFNEREFDLSDTSEFEGKIAVIGMSGRFPGARDLDAFWANLSGGVESIRPLSDDELLAAGESLVTIRDPAYVAAAAPLEDIDQFDAAFFGMSPRDAAVFDPQHRLFLECAWEVFEHAGYVPEHIDGAVGVFASCGLSEYMFKNVMANEQVARTVGEWLVRHTGNDTNFLATRVSYEFDLQGPSLNVQTACSSTLVAVHMACQSLLSGESDLALAGGAVVAPTQHRGYFYKEGEILSPDGHCRAFDARSAGTVISSACGAVLLKPLDRAMADGDNVLAVILGSAINNDGRAKVGYLAPSVSGQARVVSEALAVAGVDARDVSYIEAHGTGTLIGDPIEIAGLTQAFRESTDDTQFCAIGSLKTNIGHTGEASGIGALIKTVLSLQHAEIPPSLHYESPNPQASLPSSPFFVNASLRPWEPGPGGTRIAGITGLGAGGTNAHIIVEEAPPRTSVGETTGDAASQIISVSARSPQGAERAAGRLAAHLAANPHADLADVAFTLLAGRKGFRARRAVVASSVAEAAEALIDPKRVVAAHTRADAPGVVFMMPGGGAQYAGMGQQLYETEPVYRDAVDACCAIVNPTLGLDLRTLIFPDASSSDEDIALATKRLERPSVALPALFTTEYAMAALLGSRGIRPAAMIGHSAGEYVAACLAGVISVQDGLALVALRGRLFETLPVGAMLSVAMPADELRTRMHDDLSIAAINSADLCVASGPVALIDELEAALAADDIDAVRVHIDVAAHSSMLEPILAEFAGFCRTVRFSPPTIPYVSNLTGTWITAEQVADPSYWVDHLRHTVRFSDGIATLLTDADRVLLEVGPGRTLTAFARLAPVASAGSAPTLRHPKEIIADSDFFLAAVARVWACGVELDPDVLFAGQQRNRVALPTYPFEHQRYWVEPDAGGTPQRSTDVHKRADIGDWFYTPSWKRTAPPPAAEQAAATWLCVTGTSTFGERIAASLQGPGRRVVTVSFGERLQPTGSDRYQINPSRASDWIELVEELRRSEAMPDHVVHATAVDTRSRALLSLSARRDPIAALAEFVNADHASLLFLAQALSAASDPMRLTVITSGVHALADEAIHPERALLHGACRVVPRELGHVTALAIDIDCPRPGTPEQDVLLARLHRELTGDVQTDVVVLRRGERWVRQFDPVRLPVADAPWTDNAVYLVSGGLGGIGLAVAEHIAATTRNATLVLVGRTPLPAEAGWDAALASASTPAALRTRLEAVRRIRDAGANVVLASADVTDEVAMRRVITSTRERFGRIEGVIHSAGILRDALIALRTPSAAAPVVDVKAKGALVLQKLLADDPPGLMVLCSSVSSIIGLPGQVDYTAANAFLDAFAVQASRDTSTRVISVNWNAWQEVGMAVDASRAEEERERIPFTQIDATSPTHLFDQVDESGNDDFTFTSVMSRDRTWLIGEHIVRGGDTMLPGTGYIELFRSAALHHHGTQSPVELSDVFFLSPFAVGEGEVRTLKMRLDRDSASLVAFSDAEAAPHATAVARLVQPGPAPTRDLDAIRARCTARREEFDGFSAQPFMQFGPRWGNLRSVDYGDHEAVITTDMPAAFAAELATLWTHPAVLDMATGSAQALIPEFDQTTTFLVPFSYGRILVRGPLPRRAISHVALRESSARDLAVFDISICDESGHEVVAIDAFTMRRVSELAPLTNRRRSGVPLEGAAIESPIDSALRDGMLPGEGVDALDRIVAADVAPQMVASSVDLHNWIAKVDAEATSGDTSTDGNDGGPQFDRPELSSEFASPSTPIERELASMWQDLLGVQRVGRDDDFFELGGQSLIAVRLFTRMRKRYSVDLPLATLFEAPTIAQCAAIVAAKLGIREVTDGEALSDDHIAADAPATPLVDVDAFRSLVTIQKGGDRVPFFCAHGAGGNVLNFRDLSIAMGRSQPFYGLQARGTDGVLTPHATIEEMATAYLDEIRAIRPHGPYIFGGYSGGGLIAYEMARQVTAAGESVPLVVLLDTITAAIEEIPITMRTRFRQFAAGPRAYVTHLVKYHLHERRQRELVARLSAILASGQIVPRELRELHLARAFGKAAVAYRLQPWKGRVVLMRAEEMNATFDVLGETYGWDRIVDGEIELVRVPGDHNTLVLEPNASTLVRALRDTLDSISAAARSSANGTAPPAAAATNDHHLVRT